MSLSVEVDSPSTVSICPAVWGEMMGPGAAWEGDSVFFPVPGPEAPPDPACPWSAYVPLTNAKVTSTPRESITIRFMKCLLVGAATWYMRRQEQDYLG